jgi:cystathionine beta-lyase/cystathionine gamma-synthase
MTDRKALSYIQGVIDNMPADWLKLTTHRLDIYNEESAKTEFLSKFNELFVNSDNSITSLANLPTAYDYVRLGHPLSCVLEWTIAQQLGVAADQIISFSSHVAPVLAILRKNKLDNKKTVIYHETELPAYFDMAAIKTVYAYDFEVKKVTDSSEILNRTNADGETNIFISKNGGIQSIQPTEAIDFYIQIHANYGSILVANGEKSKSYISAIQHVRRRETIAMTPQNSLSVLKEILGEKISNNDTKTAENKQRVVDLVHSITGTKGKVAVASSGLSTQYAIMMGLIDSAHVQFPGKAIKFIVPPNCYGGTNDQARRVAAVLPSVEIMDLPVDGDHNMVQSIDKVLETVAKQDAVPYIIAEIPTNPRVEVPNLTDLVAVLSKKRQSANGENAIAPVFILDQTFCPNIQFLSNDAILSCVQTISYVSGSKFPSGGKCTAGYCTANEQAEPLMTYIEKHLILCDNEATAHQIELLAEQMPSMNERIEAAYKNTRAFVKFIQETLPEAKINFVSDELAQEGFTPSVFSLDLPTKGNTPEERENYKRKLNLDLINRMITQIPYESKYCVSYGQLKGCYWTIPATSTQGTTKEEDKDYIARVSVSPDFDLEKHKEVFREFVEGLGSL